MNTVETIEIAIASDNNYAQHAGVLLESLFENCSEENHIRVHLLHMDDLDNKNRAGLSEIADRHSQTLHFVSVTPNLLPDLKTTSYFSLATYYRLILPDLLDSSIKKVLYLDTDMVVLNDIKTLWNTPLDGLYMAAVERPMWKMKSIIDMDESAPYFNTGVLLIDLELWRGGNFGLKAIDYAHNNPEKIGLLDQDAINALYHNKIKPLHPKWNLFTPFFKLQHANLDKTIKETITAAINAPCIIHYTGKSKPWHYMNIHPFKKYYWHYLNKTPWRDYRYIPEDLTLNNRLIKIKRRIKSSKYALKLLSMIR